VSGFVLRADAIPQVRGVEDCGVHRCAQLMIRTPDAVALELPIVDRRVVRSSTGHEEERLVVRTTIRVLDRDLDAELTLTNRDDMGFRMLVGREALRGSILVDPGRSYVGPRPSRATRRRNHHEPG